MEEPAWWRWYGWALGGVALAAALFADAMVVVTGGLEWLPVALILAGSLVPPVFMHRSMLAHRRSTAETETR